jgi:hypothetical protein
VFRKPLVERRRTNAAALVEDFLEFDFLVFPTLDEGCKAFWRLLRGSAEVLSA